MKEKATVPTPDAMREAMIQQECTYRDLSFLTGGLDPGYLNRIVRGQKVPSRRVALRIAKALGLRPDEVPAEPAQQEVAL